MMPVIAVIPSFDENTLSYKIPVSYTRALIKHGAFPIIIPYEAPFKLALSKIDGILFIGGGDPDPALWGEKPSPDLGIVQPKRDSFEIGSVRTAFYNDIPSLGICRGCQIMNVALGGTLFQDIHTDTCSRSRHMQCEPSHYPTHKILLNYPSLLYSIFKKDYNIVNSFHHQAINKLSPKLKVSAYAEDGIIEAIECPEKAFFMGVQWHPELMPDDEIQNKIFSAFIKKAEKYQGGKTWDH